MPPLNYNLDDKENTVWRHAFPREHDDSRARECAQDTFTKSGWVGVVPCRKAHFADKVDVQVFTIGSRDEYSLEERESSWYSTSECAAFRREISTSIYLSKTDPARLDEITYTMRGAESYTLDGCRRRSHLRSIARNAVFDEQACQKILGIKDYSRLAQAYAAISQQALYPAFNSAAVDQSDAHRYQTESAIHDLFNDNWIRSVSTVSLGSSNAVHLYREAFSSHVEKGYGFDDSWLSDVSTNCR